MRTRVGLGKGMGAGYKNLTGHDPVVHSMSAKGMKTSMPMASVPKIQSNPMTAQEKAQLSRYNDLVKELDYDITLDDFKEMEKELGGEITDISEHYNKEDGWFKIEVDGQEWTLAPSDDDAEEKAKEQVREDLDDDPSMFTPSWLEGHIDTENLKNQLEDDLNNMNRDYYDGIADEKSSKYEDRQKEELIDGDFLDENEYTEIQKQIEEKESKESELTSKGMNVEAEETKKVIKDLEKKRDDMVEKAVEDAVEKMTDDQLDDPIGYLEDIYGKEQAMKEAIRIGGIDTDEAVDDAVSTDGWQHFLSRYDGNSTDLKSGKVMWRED